MKYYLVGIKGSGMAGLAQILYDLGHSVSGCDVNKELFVEYSLKEKNIKIDAFEHMNYHDFDVIVVGNAFVGKYDFDGKIVKTYQEMLSDLSSKYYSIAICGTHGKTTTTNMIKKVVNEYYGCNYLVGDGQGHAHINNKYFVFEACEHRDHFLSYYPNIIVCTNIDFDHVEYFKNKNQYKKSFHLFFKQVKDNLILNDTISYNLNNKTTFGFNNANIKAINITLSSKGICFDLLYNKNTYKNIYLPFYGKHMLANSLACISCCLTLNIPLSNIINSLKTYKDAGRRYNITFVNSSIIIDDYGHHPNEILATTNAIYQEFPNKKLYIVYHPDRPKRLSYFKKGYSKIFKKAYKTYVLDFLDQNEESKNAIHEIVDNEKISKFTNDFFNNDFSDSVILFTGSKEMKDIIKKLKSFL